MATSLQDRLLRDAQLDAGLVAALASSPFGWYFGTLPQGAALPAVVTMLISNPAMYSVTRRYRYSRARVQFTIWGGQYLAGHEARYTVAQALDAFMDTWAGGYNPPPWVTQADNHRLNSRDFEFVQTDTPIYGITTDYMIYWDETL